MMTGRRILTGVLAAKTAAALLIDRSTPRRPSRRQLAGLATGCVAAAVVALAGPPELGSSAAGVAGVRAAFAARAAAPAQDRDPYYRHVETWAMPDVNWNATPGAGALPAAIANDAAGQLYVADWASLSVLVYSPEGTLVKQLTAPDGAAGQAPWALAVDDVRQQVHVLWVLAESLVQPGPTYATISMFRTDGSVVSHSVGFDPDGIAVERLTGRTLIPYGSNVFQVDPATAWIWQSTRVGNAQSGRVAALSGFRLAVPHVEGHKIGIWARNSDSLGTVDLGTDEILDVASKPDDTVLVLVRPQGPGPEQPVVVAVDPSPAAIAQGRAITGRFTLGDLDAPPMPDVEWPWDLTTSPTGFAFVTGNINFEARSYGYDGAPAGVLEFGRVQARPAPDKPGGARVQAFAHGADGRLLVLNGRDNAVVAFGTGGLSEPLGRVPDDVVDFAAAGPADVIVTTAADQIMRVPLSPDLAPAWVARCDCPLGGRVTAGAGVVYVTRSRSQEVGAFDLETGAAVSQVRLPDAVGLWPTDVTMSSNGRLLTADLITSQIQVWRDPASPEVSWQAGLLAGPRRLAARTLADGSNVAGVVTADGFVEIHDAESGTLLSRWRPLNGDDAFPVSDIAIGPDARVYLADSDADVIRVFAPGSDAVPTPVPNPSPTATPSALSCTVTGDKVAGPPVVVLGNTASVTLTLAADCPNQTKVTGADVVLVLDRSSCMVGAKFVAANAVARALVEILDIRYHRIGLVSFADAPTLDVPLTTDSTAVVDVLAGMSTSGATNISDAVTMADDHLSTAGRSDALPVIVLLTDGHWMGSDPVVPAQTARNRGVQIFTIGFGKSANEAVLKAMAGSDQQYLFDPSPEDLYPLYADILRLVSSSLAGNVLIDDQMSDDVTYVDGSAVPAALESRERLRWGRSLLPSSGVTLTYQIRPLALGLIPTNLRAAADYTDADGVHRTFLFPVPKILVVAPTPTPAPEPRYLPAVFGHQCIESTAHADIVMAIDTSSSMEPDKIFAAREAARAFVDHLDLPEDQAAVIGFASTARLATGLSGDRAALHRAIAGLTTSAGTKIDAALYAAAEEIRSGAGRNPANKGVVVLMSDGAHNGPAEEVLAAAEALRPFVSAIYTIGLGADVDASLLRQVASPGGYYFAPDRFALESVYRAIAVRIPCG